MADGEPDVSFSLPDDFSTAELSGINDPIDLNSLADFEDETALLNELLTANNLEDSVVNDVNGDGSSDGIMSLLELDVKLTRLLGLFEHACSDTSSQVERAIEDVSRAVPRLSFDLQLMRENVTLLRFTLDSIRKRSIEATAHNETSDVMRRLKVLDTIKTRMESARDVLREAEAWSTLESEVTALVQEQAYVRAADRLAEANKSMVVFQNTSEYEARRSLMVSLQNGLEAGLSASLVAAINARDMAVCKNYYAIFGQIQRETEFRNYYFASRRAALLKEWQAAKLSDCLSSYTSNETWSQQTSYTSSNVLPTTFSNYLPTFYSNLLATINDERTYIPIIFPDPMDTLSSLLQSTLDCLVPSFPQRISDLSNSHGPRLLLELIKIYHFTEEFAVSVDRIFSSLALSLRPPMESPMAILSPAGTPGMPMKRSHSGSSSSTMAATGGNPAGSVKLQQKARRQSKPVSMSRRHSRGRLHPFGSVSHSQNSTGGGSASPGSTHSNGAASSPGYILSDELEPIRAWETSLFEPFLDWQAEYSDLESRLLRNELNQVTADQDAMAIMLSSSSEAANEGDEEDEDGEMGKGLNGNGDVRSTQKGGAKILIEQTLAVFALAENALGRAMALTHGYGAAGFVEAVDGAFKTFFLKQRDTLSRVKELRSRKKGEAVSIYAANGNGSIAEKSIKGEEVDMEYSQQDWATFQLALRLLETCRTIWERIAGLEQKVRTRLVDVARLLKEARQDPNNQLVPGTSRGALGLLWQSTLNSTSLSTLLDSVENQHQYQSFQPAPLFIQARSASIDLTRASQLYLHDTILGPIMQTLETYSHLSAWKQSSDSRLEARGAFDLHIPTFSLSPSETITRLGEGLFNLPGMFELYAEDDALGFSLETLPGLDAETIKTLRKEHGSMLGYGSGSLHISPQPSPNLRGIANRHKPTISLAGNEFLPEPALEPQHVHQQGQSMKKSQASRTSPTLSHQASHSLSYPLQISQSPSSNQTPLRAEVVISTWLSSLTRSVLLHLTEDILPAIPSLTKRGADQLLSDLGYISNVAKALDVELEQIEKWRNALEYTTEPQGNSNKSNKSNGLEPDLQLIEDNELVDVVKRMRASVGIRMP